MNTESQCRISIPLLSPIPVNIAHIGSPSKKIAYLGTLTLAAELVASTKLI
jgi:hypothetical protein